MNNQDSLRQVIKRVNDGKSYPAVSLVKSDPTVAALISKLVKPIDGNQFDVKKKDSHYNLNQNQIKAISDSVRSRIKDNENITLLFPDIELAVQILVSSVLSPKDMVKTDIIYRCKDTILPAELSMKLIEVVSANLEGHYDLKRELPIILRDALFRTGSYVKAVLPEGILDEIINNNEQITTESFKEIYKEKDTVVNLGILGNAGEQSSIPAMERFAYSLAPLAYKPNPTFTFSDTAQPVTLTTVEVHDNFRLLKLPALIAATNKNKLKSILKPSKISTEAIKLSSTQLGDLLYKNKKVGTDTFVVVPSKSNAKRKSVGRPLVLKFPSESVIPVYLPGDEAKHFGYFVCIDEDGNPVTVNSNTQHTEGLSSMPDLQGNSKNDSLASMLLTKARRNLTSNNEVVSLDQITKVYSNIIENDLLDRLGNGIYGKNVSIASNDEIYRIMLARSLASKYTRLVFVPGELTTYFAFKYFSNGVGKSYLDDLKFLTSLRALMLLSKVMAMTKSAISHTNVNIVLDPNDPDPQKTIEMSEHEVSKTRQAHFPMGINTPVDLVDWIQRAGLTFSFEGHPGIPQTKFDFETKDLQHHIPDNDLDELLRKQTYMAFGLSPEVVDNGFNQEFATTVISNNILMSKRVIQLQEVFSVQLSDYASKIVGNDTIILDELKDLIRENKGLVEASLSDEEKASYAADNEAFFDDLIERFIETLVLDFPKPDITALNTQTTAYNEYSEALDKAIDAWISSEIVTSDISGNISGNIDSIKAVVKAHYLRLWMAENGYMNELNDIVTSDKDGKPTLNIYELSKSHNEGIILSAVEFVESLRNMKIAADKDLEKMGTEAGEQDTSSNDSTSEDNGSDGGGDDMNFDMPADDTGGTDDNVDKDKADSADDTDKPVEDKEETPA